MNITAIGSALIFGQMERLFVVDIIWIESCLVHDCATAILNS